MNRQKLWIMKQEWHDVVFLHWPVGKEWLRRFVPGRLEIDLYNGQAWIGVVLFQAKATRLRLLPPIPGTRSYLELNVRTYVKYGDRQGVYFFSLDADSPLAVEVAGFGDFLPYRHAEMKLKKRKGQLEFCNRRIPADSFPESLKITFQPDSEPIAGSRIEKWLTERYCLWTKPQKQLWRVDISHSPWSLQYIKGEIYRNSMAAFLPVSLHHALPMAHYAKKKKVRFMPPVREPEKEHLS